MADQVKYYNHFGEVNRQSILTCKEPEIWTTDYEEKGRVYREMVNRVKEQTSLIDEFFVPSSPVLDIGCGFGRQAILLAKRGFSVTGLDSSKTFIQIAQELFNRHNLHGNFLNCQVEDAALQPFSQIILFDVIEHIKPSSRKTFIRKIHTFSAPAALVIVSLPHVKERLTSQLNNNVRKRITQHFSYFLGSEEHPYPIPTAQIMKELIDGLFTILRFKQTAVTDYYVLRKL